MKISYPHIDGTKIPELFYKSGTPFDIDYRKNYMEVVEKDYLKSNTSILVETDKLIVLLGYGTSPNGKGIEGIGDYGSVFLNSSILILKDESLTIKEIEQELILVAEQLDTPNIFFKIKHFVNEKGEEVFPSGSGTGTLSRGKCFIVNKENSIDDWITNKIKQKRRSNYRSLLKRYGDTSQFKTIVKFAEDKKEIEEFTQFCIPNHIQNKFGGDNYIEKEHLSFFFQHCFDYGIPVLLVKVYKDEVLIGAEFAFVGGDRINCAFGYEDTLNYSGLGIYCVMKQIEFMCNSKEFTKCDYGYGCSWKKDMGMESEKQYLFFYKRKKQKKND